MPNLFQKLSDDKLIRSDFNWCKDIDYTHFIFNLYFDNNLDSIFLPYKQSIEVGIDHILQYEYIHEESLINEPDNLNKIFLAKYIIDPTNCVVYNNKNVIENRNYKIHYNGIVFHMPPKAGSILTISYFPKCIKYNYHKIAINSLMRTLDKDLEFTNYATQIIKNIFQGSVTKELYLKFLSYFSCDS